METTKTTIEEKRVQLKALSKVAKMMMQTGDFGTINEALVEIYRAEGHEEIETFKTWLTKGFCVRRGEKALLLWGQPKKAQKQEKQASDSDADEFKFFPLAFVFSNKQVDPLPKKQHAEA